MILEIYHLVCLGYVCHWVAVSMMYMFTLFSFYSNVDQRQNAGTGTYIIRDPVYMFETLPLTVGCSCCVENPFVD